MYCGVVCEQRMYTCVSFTPTSPLLPPSSHPTPSSSLLFPSPSPSSPLLPLEGLNTPTVENRVDVVREKWSKVQRLLVQGRDQLEMVTGDTAIFLECLRTLLSWLGDNLQRGEVKTTPTSSDQLRSFVATIQVCVCVCVYMRVENLVLMSLLTYLLVVYCVKYLFAKEHPPPSPLPPLPVNVLVVSGFSLSPRHSAVIWMGGGPKRKKHSTTGTRNSSHTSLKPTAIRLSRICWDYK